MPEIEITQEQDRAIRDWLQQQVETGGVELRSDGDERVKIPLVAGEPVLLGGGADQNDGEVFWISGGADVFARMKKAGLNLDPIQGENLLPVVWKAIHQNL